MNVAVMRTKTELALSEGFERVADALPGGAETAKVRRAAVERFAEIGLPHRRIEEWKYTDLRGVMKEVLPLSLGDATKLTIADIIVALGPLAHIEATRAVLVNGRYRPELSSPEVPEGLRLGSLAAALVDGSVPEDALARHDGADADAVLALNTAYMTDGAIVEIAADAQIEKPVMVVNVRAGGEARLAATRHVVRAGKGSSATLIEASLMLPGASAEGQTNAASDVVLEEGARLTHVQAVVDAGAVTHLSNTLVELGADSDYRGFQLTQGVGLARNQIFATFSGEGASLDLSGAFQARGGEHVDTTLKVDHAVPGCTSRELFKGVLDGAARGVFQGKIVVRQIAQKTDGKQMAQALMLSPDAEFDSKPELEIFADDVACGHGSTVAELDADLMFYCKSRGIPEREARVLLIGSFIGEAIDKVEHEATAEALRTFAADWLLAGRG